MIGRVLNVEDWAEIRRPYRAEGLPIRAICRQLGVGRNTVRRALAAESAPRYQRRLKGSIVDGVEPRIDLPRERAPMAVWRLQLRPFIGGQLIGAAARA
jgi:transposase